MSVQERVAGLHCWLQEAAWPHWLANGIDRPHQGFHESLPCEADFRRLRVVARQVYVFSEAHRAGQPGAADAVRLGIAFLEQHAALPDGGYAWRFGLDNRVIDATRDLYDQAFVLLALASATAVLPAAPLRAKALALLDWLDATMAHPEGGYRESEPDPPPGSPRRQNPHMHLLEALLAAHASFGDGVFLQRATDMVGLFLERMFDPSSGALPEFFDEFWTPVAHAGGYVVEPGHHCEWVWLLDRYPGSDPQLVQVSAALMRFVDRFGRAAHGGVRDTVTSRGTVLAASTRLWGQCERLKAELIRCDIDVERQIEAADTVASYLKAEGTWHDRKDADGRDMQAPAPATSLYHLTSAILTAQRLLTPGAAPHTSAA